MVKTAVTLVKHKGGKLDLELLLKIVDMRVEFLKAVQGAADGDAMNSYT